MMLLGSLILGIINSPKPNQNSHVNSGRTAENHHLPELEAPEAARPLGDLACRDEDCELLASLWLCICIT